MNKSEGSLCEGGHAWKVGWELVLPRAGKTLLVEMDRRGPQRGQHTQGPGGLGWSPGSACGPVTAPSEDQLPPF